MKPTRFDLLIATSNPGKLNEFVRLLSDLPVNLKSLSDFPGIQEVEETGETFENNALLKACAYARKTRMWTLADDSGLEVEALGGRPGVYSARYGGSAAGYEKKIELLLKELKDTGETSRLARFACVIALANERGETKFIAEGECRGSIAGAPSGENGFGYDPVFIPEGFDQTFGELSENTKEQISHRARAAAKIIRYLRDFIGV